MNWLSECSAKSHSQCLDRKEERDIVVVLGLSSLPELDVTLGKLKFLLFICYIGEKMCITSASSHGDNYSVDKHLDLSK